MGVREGGFGGPGRGVPEKGSKKGKEKGPFYVSCSFSVLLFDLSLVVRRSSFFVRHMRNASARLSLVPEVEKGDRSIEKSAFFPPIPPLTFPEKVTKK